MDVTGLLVIEPASERSNSIHNAKSDILEACWPVLPKAFLPLLGRPLVFRLLESLALSGVREFRVFCAADAASPDTVQARKLLEEKSKQTVRWTQCDADDLWPCVIEETERVFSAGAKAALVSRCDSYFELGSATALTNCLGVCFARLTSAKEASGVFWATRQGWSQLRSALERGLAVSNPPEVQAVTCYNRLDTATDLRQLTEDAFNLQLAYRPVGREIRPGVWAGDRTRIHRTARIVAPAFIGSGTKIRAAALVTRGSSIESHCEVDCGTVVQASNLMPYTYIGAGLELLHSVAGSRHVANAAKKRTAEIIDSKLLREMPGAPALRVVESAGKLASFLPKQIFRTLASTVRPSRAKSTPDIARTAIATTMPAAAETAFAATIAATSGPRDHGNE